MAVAEALTNIAAAPLADGLSSVSLSANWMWPCKNQGEDAALYRAVKACSDFACSLGINIPTGKDSLSMTQKYGNDKVFAPGTVIISAAGETADVRLTVSPVVRNVKSTLYYIDFSADSLRLGGSALAQALNTVGSDAPTVADPAAFMAAFGAVQKLVKQRGLLAAHDVSAGGLVTALLEMTFANTRGGLDITTEGFVSGGEAELMKILFAENPAMVIQVSDRRITSTETLLTKAGVKFHKIGHVAPGRNITIAHNGVKHTLDIDAMRDVWFRTSYLLDRMQSGEKCASLRMANYKKQPLRFNIASSFDGSLESRGLTAGKRPASGVRAAIIREKGVNGDREMAYSLYLAGFDVKDVHMTDLMSGRENLEDVNMIVFCGGFSNSDVLGSAKGWAGGFLWNDNARKALENFYKRTDTLSLGVCNGCQLMMELNLINPEMPKKGTMEHNISHKFESQFVGVTIPENNSVMFGPLAGLKTGIWVAHGEGKFNLPMPLDNYNVALRYNYSSYPGNPNGSRGAVAGLCSPDGRHLAMMPHLERAIFPWQCAYYPEARQKDDVTPWIDAFVNARKWIEKVLKN